MPLYIYRKLGFGDLKATSVTLQLIDRSIKHPSGFVEDMLIKVEDLIFLVDFIIHDV